MNFTFLRSTVTWSFVATFIIGGLSWLGVLPAGTTELLITLLAGLGLTVHNNQIKTGKVR